jgi:hypothetical protein|uniref:Uncharacterized protein At2g40313 n=1 Tax=Arabidopsis thaliana TaxID=3702 RepID=Q9XEF7_ARATH|nr:hypothetical protein [Arabidopsis thaliana]AAM15351.1 hypothetical protein [Arabidopsis thaliana]
MSGKLWIPRFILITLLFISSRVNSQCEFSFTGRNKVFHFNLASSIRNYPHGVLSEDGFYKVEANSSVLWFQVVFYIRLHFVSVFFSVTLIITSMILYLGFLACLCNSSCCM